MLDFSYDEFPNQACTSDQFLAERSRAFAAASGDIGAQIGVAMGYNNALCAQAGVNNMAGKPSAHSPDFTASIIANYIADYDGFDVITNVDINHRSEVFRTDDLDPISYQPNQTFVNASVKFDMYQKGWAVTLLAKNLTDVEHFSYINDVPLFAGAHNFMPNAGRNYMVKLSYEFGE